MHNTEPLLIVNQLSSVFEQTPIVLELYVAPHETTFELLLLTGEHMQNLRESWLEYPEKYTLHVNRYNCITFQLFILQCTV